jgi:hypothetical protein
MSRLFGSVSAQVRTGVCLLGLGVLAVGCVEQADDKPSAEDQEFVKKNLLKTAPTPQFVVNADLDGKVSYLGADVSPNPAEAGKDLKVTHYWKVSTPPGEGWRTFTHAQGPSKASYMNVDHGPVRGKYPVSQWKAGDIIRDEHVFRVPATWQYDHLQVHVGLWRRNERMTIKSGPHDEQGRVLAFSVPVKGAAPAPQVALKKYLVRKTAKPIKADGKLDEAAWKTAPSTGVFVNTMTGAATDVKTEAKMLWDDQFLYVAFENVDSDIWSTLTKRDDKLWTQEAVEVMIDADGNGKSYVELQVAPNGNLFDTYLPEYRKYEDSIDPKRKMYDWNSKTKVGVKVDGTLNKRDDQDKGWTVEMAIPLADVNGLATNGVKVPPALGDMWRINMYRMDQNGKGPQAAVGWSPPMQGDFHVLSRFGQVVFADESGNVPAPAPAAAVAAKAGKNPEMAHAAAEAAKGMPSNDPNAANVIRLEAGQGHKTAAAAKGKKSGDAKHK